jgi:uncharacterized caspase-like protein
MSRHRNLIASCSLVLSTLASTASLHAQTTPTPPASLPQTPPTELVLTIDSPAGWSQAGYVGTRDISANIASSIHVTGTARHPQGVARVLLKGYEAKVLESPDGTVEFDGYIRVEEQMTSAEVVVVTKSNNRLINRYNITPVEPPKSPPAAAFQAKSSEVGFSGRRWAVIIGISEYADTSIKGLRYAASDAKAFYDFVRSPLAGGGGFDPKYIRVLLNKDATYQNMRLALRQFLREAAPEDLVYVYFAGHGAPDPTSLKDLYLLPYDVRRTQIASGAYPMDDVVDAVNKVAATHKILITDACHSGGLAGGGTRGGLEINEINDAFLQRLRSSKGVNATFTASGPNETSAEGDQWRDPNDATDLGHGVFTYHLIEGLKGKADKNGDNIVDLAEMFEYTYANVATDTKQTQKPMRSNMAYDESFPVAAVLPGVPITKVPLAEIETANRLNAVADAVVDYRWTLPDSILLVVGARHALEVRAENPNRDVVPQSLLIWSTSNPAVARVESNGEVIPVGAGSATISGSYNLNASKRAVTLIQVLPQPSDVQFYPQDTNLVVVLTDKFQIRSDLLIGTDRWERGMAPQVVISDTLSLRQMPNLEFLAYRPGTATLKASIAGRTREWAIRVIPPNVKANPVPVAMALNDSVALAASRVRPDASVLGPAPNVTWRSLDTLAVVRDNRLIARGIGRARVVATLGNATDTVSTFVLGDLLVAIDGKSGPQIVTMAIGSAKAVPLAIPKDVRGSQPTLSPKGDRIAFVSAKDKRLYVMDPDGSNLRRLTADMRGFRGTQGSYEEHSPSWTSDGSRVVFMSNAYGGNYQVLSVSADGTDVQRLTSTNRQELNVATAFDAPRIAFERYTAGTNADIVIALADGSEQEQIQHKVPFGSLNYSMVKPQFINGTQFVVFAAHWAGTVGESLCLMDLEHRVAPVKELLPAKKDNNLLFAVSPNGQYIAVHRKAEWGSTNSSIAIIDLNGAPFKQLNLPAGTEIKSIAWGASFPLKRGK